MHSLAYMSQPEPPLPTIDVGSWVWEAGFPSSLIHRNLCLVSFDEPEIRQENSRKSGMGLQYLGNHLGTVSGSQAIGLTSLNSW